MSVFEGEVLNQTIAVAAKHKIEAEALLAVVEVESAGKSLEVDGKTPCLLFERHIFYRELKKAKKEKQLAQAIDAGLAIPTWSRNTQYRDQGSSKQRLAVYARAKAIDAECAARSCSWGVGQTCGFVAEEANFPDAVTMLSYMTHGGVPAQVDCMVREVEVKHLVSKLNAHNWAAFARAYNGPGYAENNYDGKMAAAYAKWKAKGIKYTPAEKPVVVPPEIKPAPVQVPTPVTEVTATKAGGLAAALAGLWAALETIDYRIVAFVLFIGALVIVTTIVLWRRHKEANIPSQGTFAAVDTGV